MAEDIDPTEEELDAEERREIAADAELDKEEEDEDLFDDDYEDSDDDEEERLRTEDELDG